MRSFTLITALILCCINWISVSVSETQTVEVQLGQEVTLLCPNISKRRTQTEWFRLVSRTEVSCVSAMRWSDGKVSFCDGFQNRFEMSSNITTVFLQIKRVDFSDSGLYFCGFYIYAHTVIANTIHLNVQGNGESCSEVDFKTEGFITETPDGITNLMTVVLGALTVFLTIVIIVLAVKIRKLQTAVNEEPQTERNKNLGSDDLNYAALSFQSKAKRKRRPPSERELEPNVVYAATR
uniref:Ig-like domain-containing protein n=1 Tax=Lates calcarifer TaxID=8187 RepID=A0A4W6CWI4_LATCA